MNSLVDKKRKDIIIGIISIIVHILVGLLFIKLLVFGSTNSDNGDGQLKYKMLLQSQVSYKTDAPKDEDFHNWDRVLKKYVKDVELRGY